MLTIGERQGQFPGMLAQGHSASCLSTRIMELASRRRRRPTRLFNTLENRLRLRLRTHTKFQRFRSVHVVDVIFYPGSLWSYSRHFFPGVFLGVRPNSCGQAHPHPNPRTERHHGRAAWYPEQWPESRWEEDLRLMEAAHLKVVRIAEFAWSRMEPSEGHYDFDWLERAINLAAKHHIITVLGTPTATPPAWLTQKYPDTLRVEQRASGSRTGTARRLGDVPCATANSAARLPSRWRCASAQSRMSSAGRSTTNTATR